MAEGIETPANLAEFDKDDLDVIFHNLRKPARTRVGGGGGRGGGAAILVETEPHALPAKSQMCIYAFALMAKYYQDIGRDHDPDNML